MGTQHDCAPTMVDDGGEIMKEKRRMHLRDSDAKSNGSTWTLSVFVLKRGPCVEDILSLQARG